MAQTTTTRTGTANTLRANDRANSSVHEDLLTCSLTKIVAKLLLFL